MLKLARCLGQCEVRQGDPHQSYPARWRIEEPDGTHAGRQDGLGGVDRRRDGRLRVDCWKSARLIFTVTVQPTRDFR